MYFITPKNLFLELLVSQRPVVTIAGAVHYRPSDIAQLQTGLRGETRCKGLSAPTDFEPPY